MSVMRKTIKAYGAPQAIGPYSQAVRVGGLLFLSGQIAIDPVTNDLAYGGITVQVHQIFANIRTILKSEDLDLDDVVKCTVFLADMNDFNKMNKAYGEYFKENLPARSCIQAAKLPRGADIEIEVIAAYPD